MSSSAEAECGELLYNSKELESLRTTLTDMRHPQQSTEIITDNSKEGVIMKGTIKQKLTKTMDMHFYWVRDIVEQNNFVVKWKLGHMNFGN